MHKKSEYDEIDMDKGCMAVLGSKESVIILTTMQLVYVIGSLLQDCGKSPPVHYYLSDWK